jgi:FkbM family methyltransferase
MPAESSLPSVLSRHLRYGRNLALIAEAVAAKYPGSPIIDVGANIGDTAILMRSSSDAPILCIEGSEMYADIFRSNLNESSKLTLIQKLVDTGDSTLGEILVEHGSGRASRNGNLRSVALPDIASEHGFSNAKLIKIDTDGFDGRIIQAALPWLALSLPVLFWEFELCGDKENGGPGLRIFELLAGAGYERFMFYTDTGDYVATAHAGQDELLQDLAWYFGERENRSHLAPHFADVCAIPSQDLDLHQAIVAAIRRAIV